MQASAIFPIFVMNPSLWSASSSQADAHPTVIETTRKSKRRRPRILASARVHVIDARGAGVGVEQVIGADRDTPLGRNPIGQLPVRNPFGIEAAGLACKVLNGRETTEPDKFRNQREIIPVPSIAQHDLGLRQPDGQITLR